MVNLQSLGGWFAKNDLPSKGAVPLLLWAAAYYLTRLAFSVRNPDEMRCSLESVHRAFLVVESIGNGYPFLKSPRDHSPCIHPSLVLSIYTSIQGKRGSFLSSAACHCGHRSQTSSFVQLSPSRTCGPPCDLCSVFVGPTASAV
ncbi:hypothetical protein PGTUg99_037269 [Puccinia graminis f. sp. tritici]|uniref:Uncharacterized protein n=1 Tax=Puccinia graminis f. sp. tritici TaxID=56615 RepID=A0A5B0SMR9_PUCGR|nr:hypothetical protein PGTUg99_037269 [Puccinia graminis f. sp. tritici]